ncbi:hypothetical protein HKX48_001883 [Thoreauomyces humboldtii]|nr:hypothetical protein HKX48_001883 [Thoreauomyces humboldtii]
MLVSKLHVGWASAFPDGIWFDDPSLEQFEEVLRRLKKDIKRRDRSLYSFEDPYHFLEPGYFANTEDGQSHRDSPEGTDDSRLAGASIDDISDDVANDLCSLESKSSGEEKEGEEGLAGDEIASVGSAGQSGRNMSHVDVNEAIGSEQDVSMLHVNPKADLSLNMSQHDSTHTSEMELPHPSTDSSQYFSCSEDEDAASISTEPEPSASPNSILGPAEAAENASSGTSDEDPPAFEPRSLSVATRNSLAGPSTSPQCQQEAVDEAALRGVSEDISMETLIPRNVVMNWSVPATPGPNNPDTLFVAQQMRQSPSAQLADSAYPDSLTPEEPRTAAVRLPSHTSYVVPFRNNIPKVTTPTQRRMSYELREDSLAGLSPITNDHSNDVNFGSPSWDRGADDPALQQLVEGLDRMDPFRINPVVQMLSSPVITSPKSITENLTPSRHDYLRTRLVFREENEKDPFLTTAEGPGLSAAVEEDDEPTPSVHDEHHARPSTPPPATSASPLPLYEASYTSDDEFDHGLLVFEGTPTRTALLPTDWEPPNVITPIRRALGDFNTPSTPSTVAFARKRVLLAAALYAEFNESVFGGKLPDDLTILWSRKLHTTAGRCFQERTGNVYMARIDLSTKVVDTIEKLRTTLMHEMCHAAQWIVDHTNKPAHGKVFKYWGQVAERVYPDIKTRACHSYEIAFKFWYVCQRCDARYGRHSKSINVATHGCGACRGRLTLVGDDQGSGSEKTKKDGTPRKVNRFTEFVKDNFANIKQAHPELKHRELMMFVGKRFREAAARDDTQVESARETAAHAVGS